MQQRTRLSSARVWCGVISLISLLSGCGGKRQPKTLEQLKNGNYWERRHYNLRVERDVTKNLSDMNLQELEHALGIYTTTNNTYMIMRCLEYLVSAADTPGNIKKYRLALADSYFDQGMLEKAAKMYREYATLYPGCHNLEYAEYKAVLASFYLTLSPDRDQTQTQQTVQLAQAFLHRDDVYHTYTKDVYDICQQCYEKLVDSELNVASFYLNKFNYSEKARALDAAKARVAHVRKEYIGKIPNIEVRLLEFDCAIAQAENNEELFVAKQQELAALNPAEPTYLASAKRDYVAKF